MRISFILIIILIFGCAKSDSDFEEKFSEEGFGNFEYYEGLSSYNLQHGGLNREYLLYIPPNLQSRTNLPVIFNFHGYSGQADQFYNMSDLVDVANENGVVLVYPQGALLPGGSTHWNAAPTNGPNSFFSPGIMGPYSFIPFMECYHGILSMNHNISGVINHNGIDISFDGGKGYMEKDWGHSFPKAYIWMQSNHFSKPNISIKSSIAIIPWLKSSFIGHIILQKIYDSSIIKSFFLDLLNKDELHPYEDPLSSININYYDEGDALGWHFDNASFAITLMIQSSTKGGEFEYITEGRDSNSDYIDKSLLSNVIEGKTKPNLLDVSQGTLILFYGRNYLHRVTPVRSKKPRILVTLNYNLEKGVELSLNARKTFFGRIK